MTRKGKLLLVGFLLVVAPLAAWATNDTIGVTAGSGKLANLIKFVSTNVMSEVGICDATTENQCAIVSAGGAVKVDGSAVTQPVSGSVTANAGTNLNTSALATSANQATEISSLASIATSAATTATNTGAAIPTQAPTVSIGGVGIVDSAGTNVATVKAASTIPAATDKTLVVGLNPGTATAGTPAGAIVTVQGVPSMTKLLVTPDSVALPANQSVNESQINGVTPLMGNGVSGTGSQRVNIASDNTPFKVGIDQTTDVTTNGVEIAPTAGAAAGITPVISAAAEANHILKAGAGNLYAAYATSTVAGYLLIFNATTAPADGAVTPQNCIPGALTQSGIYAASISYNPGPAEVFTTGITASWSSTGCFTKTASATAFIHGSVK